MATAVEPGSEPRTPSPPASLTLASIVGAVYVAACVAVVFYAVPTVWRESVAPQLGRLGFVGDAFRWVVQIAALLGLVWFGRRLLGATPPRGIHGGIFLVISWGVTIFFLWRAVALNVEGQAGMIVSGLVAALLLFLAVRFFTGPVGRRWMVGLEEQGWFSTASYKRSLGQRVRRLTILGVLLVGASGVYSLTFQGVLPENWTLAMPFDLNPVTVLTDARYAIPLLLIGATLWIAYRAVNVPPFAEFLIATEAEMNKVSWTSKRRLTQDTIVVLTTTLLMALFLLVVDLFWGWLLSRETVGVLPGNTTNPDKAGKAQQARW